jgi:hypothetical protein
VDIVIPVVETPLSSLKFYAPLDINVPLPGIIDMEVLDLAGTATGVILL